MLKNRRDQQHGFWIVRVVYAVCIVVTGYGCLATLNKYHFCAGWSEQYADRAAQARREAASPGLGEADRHGYLIHAEQLELIAKKYRSTAITPWRPYPSYPLVTQVEKIEIRERIMGR